MKTTVRMATPKSSERSGPFDLTVDPIARFLNFELADHPIYEAVEVQWFDDSVHGTGMLAFLSRRVGRTVDYYHQPGVTLDPVRYTIGGGTGVWMKTEFEAARLEIAPDGIDVDVRFTDVDGRLIEVRVNDRDGHRRRRAHLLAPVSAGIDHPSALLLVWLSGFDLVRRSGQVVIRIQGKDARIGTLPGGALHRRRLIKYGAPLCAVELNHNHNGPLADGRAESGDLTALVVEQDGHTARFELEPALPDLAALPDAVTIDGTWRIEVDGATITGGRWRATRTGQVVRLALDVEQTWKPHALPLLMRVVTRVIPVFRQWPKTYRWRGTVWLGPEPTLTSAWERTTTDAADGYRRATGS
jgi:hypothetical protein